MINKGFKHIGSRLFFSFLLMAAITVLVLWLIQAGFMRDSYVNSKLDSIEAALTEMDDSSIEAIEEKTAASLIVFNESNKVTYRSQGLPMMGMMQRTAQSMLPVQSTDIKYINTSHTSVRYAVMGVAAENGSSVFAVFSLADADEASRLLRQQLWIITLIMVILSAVFSAWLSRRFSSPVKELTLAADKIAAGDYEVSLDVQSQDELGKLTLSLNAMTQQLQKNDQLQRELIANVSHELKAPLTVIRGYAETVRDVSWPDQEKRNTNLSIIIDETERLRMIVQDILDYSQLQAGTLILKQEVFAFRPVLDKCLQTLKQHIDARGLEIVITGKSCDVMFDRNRLRQVIFNLLTNAVQYAKPVSEIIISLEEYEKSANNLLRFSISNQGYTIPAEEISSIWNRYHRSSHLPADAAIGTGLGLAIVRSIMQQHSSDYGVTSQAGQTTFWIDLPVISSASQQG